MMTNVVERTFLIPALVLAGALHVHAGVPPITAVTSPAPASTHFIGERLAITWKAETTFRDLRIVIDISIDGKRTWTQVTPEAVANGDQSYEWVIPESLLVIDLSTREWVPVSSVSDQVYLLLYEYDGDSGKATAGPFRIQRTSASTSPRVKRAAEPCIPSHVVSIRHFGAVPRHWSAPMTLQGKTMISRPSDEWVRGQMLLLGH